MGAYGLWPLQLVVGLVLAVLFASAHLWIGALGGVLLIIGGIAKIVEIRAAGRQPSGGPGPDTPDGIG